MGSADSVKRRPVPDQPPKQPQIGGPESAVTFEELVSEERERYLAFNALKNLAIDGALERQKNEVREEGKGVISYQEARKYVAELIKKAGIEVEPVFDTQTDPTTRMLIHHQMMDSTD